MKSRLMTISLTLIYAGLWVLAYSRKEEIIELRKEIIDLRVDAAIRSAQKDLTIDSIRYFPDGKVVFYRHPYGVQAVRDTMKDALNEVSQSRMEYSGEAER